MCEKKQRGSNTERLGILDKSRSWSRTRNTVSVVPFLFLNFFLLKKKEGRLFFGSHQNSFLEKGPNHAHNLPSHERALPPLLHRRNSDSFQFFHIHTSVWPTQAPKQVFKPCSAGCCILIS